MGTSRVNGRVSSNTSLRQPVGRNQREIFQGTQEDFLSDWATLERKVKSIDQMMKNSPLIGGAVRLAIEMSIRKVDWYFTSENGEDDPLLDFVRESWKNLALAWDDHISDAVLSPFYGWATFTNQYERVNGRLMWKNFKFLTHDTHYAWNYDDMGQVESLEQMPHLWAQAIPRQRLLIYRFRYNGNNPEGESILRPAWTSFYYGSNLEELRAIGYERHAVGMGVVKMPMGADPTVGGKDHNTASEIIRNMRLDEQGGLIIPPPNGEGDHNRWDISLTSAANPQVFIALNNTISEYDRKIMMSALAQFIILGMANVGTQAKAEADVSFFTMAIDALADALAEQFTKQEVMRLGQYNGLDLSPIKLEHSPAGDIDTATLIEFIKATGGGMNWTAEDEIQLRSVFDLPEKTVEQIEEEAERKRAVSQQIMTQRQSMPQANGDDSEFGLYAASPVADNAPDARQRRQLEQQWNDRLLKYARAQQRRIKQGLKE